MKYINFWHLCLVLSLCIGNLSYAQSPADLKLDDDERLIEFTTDRFTLPNLHITPDKKHIIFDVLGDIYQVPIEGGKAEVLLQDSNWKRGAKLSPDGKILAYVSDETGRFQIWTYNLETKEKRVYSTIESIHYPLFPFWDAENNLIIPDKKGILSYDLLTQKEENIRPTPEEERSIISATALMINIDKAGKNAYIQKDNQIYVYNLKTHQEKPVEATHREKKQWIKHYRINKKTDKLIGIESDKKGFNDLFVIDLDVGKRINLTKLITLGPNVTIHQGFDFVDDNHIIIDIDGKINKMNLKTGDYKPIPIQINIQKVIKKPLQRTPQYIQDSLITASVLRSPETRKNIDKIYFHAFGKLYTYAKENREIKELYPDINRFEVSSALSPNGEYLSYTTWNDTKKGHVYIKELKTGKEFKITKKPGRYINPTWTVDGQGLLYLSDQTIDTKSWVKFSNLGAFHYKISLYQAHLKISKKIKAKSISKIKDLKILSNLPKRYFPPIAFHPTKPHVYITTFNDNTGLAELAEINIESKEIIDSIPIPNYTDEVLVSPDAKHVAFIYDEQVWIDSYPFIPKYNFSSNSDLIPKKHHVNGGYVESISLPHVKSVYEVAPSYLYWQDEYTLMWGSAGEIYTYDVRTQKTEKIADIKVQKPRAIPQTQYALTHARILTFNQKDEIIVEGTVLIKNNRIEAVGSTSKVDIPNGYKIFDMSGKTIMPGLIDVHAHYLGETTGIPFYENYLYNDNLAYGVTTIYDPSVNVLDYREPAQLVETGRVIGPRLFASGNIIMRSPGQYDYKNIQNKLDAERIIKSNKKLGVHGPIKDYSLSDRKIRRRLRYAAKKYDMTITPDQVNFMEGISRIIDGYTSIEHLLNSSPIQKDIIELVIHSKIGYTPTLINTNILSLIQHNNHKDIPICDNRRVFLNSKELKRYIGSGTKNCTETLLFNLMEEKGNSEKRIYNHINSVKRIIEGGGNVSVGAHGNYIKGLNTHWEMWAFTLTGLNNYEALKAATINGAKKLSLQEETGSIEENKLADLLVLDANPLANIYNSILISHTILNGSIFTIKR